ncbi:MFS general substrate transporter [Peniophora sp. CONT]|nr:MFS general substrate transporter [Peniophora sp. CONT]
MTKPESVAQSAVTDEKSLDEKGSNRDHDAEVGYELYKQARDGSLEWTPEEERRVRRRIDAFILPVFCVTQGLAFLDKTALNLGNLFGMKVDLHVTGSQFSWFASAFYLGYLVFAEPATWLLQRYPTGKVMGSFVFLWGIVVMPGLGLMTPFWWRLNEQPLRHLSWYCFNGVGGIIGDLLAYGFGHVTRSAVPNWALIFLTLGAFTVTWGVFMFLFVPDAPPSASFLDQKQKLIAVQRVAENRTGIKNHKFKRYQLIQALRAHDGLEDPKTWILFLAAISAQIPNGVVSNFSTIIIKGLGFGLYETVLLDIPSSLFQIGSLVLSGYIAGRFKNMRCIMMFTGNCVCIIAAAVLTYGPQDKKWGRLVAFWFTSFQSVGFSLSLVMVSANVGGFTKRQVTAVIVFIGYCAGNIAGPHVLIDSEAELGYPTATKAMMAGYAAKCGLHAILGLYMLFENCRRDRRAEVEGYALPEEERSRLAVDAGMNDVTEHDNKWFRYVL